MYLSLVDEADIMNICVGHHVRVHQHVEEVFFLTIDLHRRQDLLCALQDYSHQKGAILLHAKIESLNWLILHILHYIFLFFPHDVVQNYVLTI